MNFDPFGLDRMIYTIQSRCIEEPEMEYDDGSVTLFLYTRGTKGKRPEKLQNLLKYMEQTTEENAVTPGLRSIQNFVVKVKTDPFVKEGYMTFAEYIERERREAAEEAAETADKKAALSEKRASAALKQASVEKHRADTLEFESVFAPVYKKYKKQKSLTEIAEELETDPARVEPYYQLIASLPDHFTIEEAWKEYCKER